MRLAAVAAACLFPGCMPFVTPPMQMSAAGGTMPTPADPGGPSGLCNARVSLHPASLLPQAHTARYDFGLGYTVDTQKLFGSRVYSQGGFLQLEYYPWVHPVTRQVAARFGPYASAETLWRGGHRGWGASGGLALELNGLVHGCDAGRGLAACGRGLLGGRVFAGMELRDLDGARYSAVVMGLGWRLPLSGGIVTY